VAIVAMIFVVIFQIAKASEYVSVLKGEEKTRKQNNRINAFLMIAFLVLGMIGAWYCNSLYYHMTLMPQGSASVEGEKIDLMLFITLGVTGLVFFITQILLFYFAYKYQEREDRKAFFFPHNNKLELLWTTVPAIFLTVLVVFGLKYWFKMTSDAPKDSVVVEITGHQFAWDMRYPGKDGKLGRKNYKLYNQPSGNTLAVDFEDPESHDDLRTTEMHLPVGRPVKLVINAMDVIHDVGLSHLKMDAVPGMQTQFKFTATMTTAQMREKLNNPNFNYEMACTEICGRGHFSMKFPVVVDTEEDYQKWLSSQEAWLKQNPDYLKYVPAELKEAAMIKAGIPLDNLTTVQTASN